MFAILNISDTNTIFSKPKIKSQRIVLPDGEAFFTVTTEKHLGRVPWKKLESCMGILRKDVILKGGVTLPEGCSITEFSPEIYPRILLMNTAVSKLKGSRHRSLVVYDEKGLYMENMDNLACIFDRIRVVTSVADKYDNVARKLMENSGFSLEVSEKSSYDADVVISHRCNVPLYFSGRVFTNERRFLMNAEVNAGCNIDLPEEYEKLRPEGVESLVFASALYEKCKVKNLGKIIYSDFDS